jgi:Flp pilus assembly protein TadB
VLVTAALAGVLASYLPSTELYAKQRSSSSSSSSGSSSSTTSQQPATARATDATEQTDEQRQDVEQQQQQAGAAAQLTHGMASADKQMSLARFAMLNFLCVTVLVFSLMMISQARDAAATAAAAGAAGACSEGQVVPAENMYLPVMTAIHGFCMPPPGQKKNPKQNL